MERKKIVTLLIAGVLTLGIVGASFAWFTSTDSAPSSFATVGNDNEVNNGINIEETFTPPTNIKPGDSTDKIIRVTNVADFAQFIRVKITLGDVTNQAGVTKGFSTAAIAANIILDYGTNLAVNKWVNGGDGYYYYIGKVGAGASTINLLEKVKLAMAADNTWQNVKYEVIIEAYGVQASNDAYLQEFSSASGTVKAALAAKQ